MHSFLRIIKNTFSLLRKSPPLISPLEYIYVTVEEIIEINKRVTKMEGLLCNRPKLESAIMRPRTAWHYEGADIVRQAALLADGICMAHAFIDGNKRTALIACVTFLNLNFCELIGIEEQQAGRAIELLVIERDLESFTQWLRDHTKLP